MRHGARNLGKLVMRAVGIGAVLAGARPAHAQMPSIGVPKGHLRLELGGEFATVNGRLFGGDQPYAADWNADVGGAFLPELAGADARIRAITGNASYRLSAGRSSVVASTQTGRGIISAAVGVTKRITIFGTLPFVRTRAQTELGLDSTDADAGINPADPILGGAAGPTTAFFSSFDAALTTLANKITNGDYDGDPTQKAQAQQTLADGTALRGEMYGLLLDPATASPFVPTTTSVAGASILATVASLQLTLSGLSVGGFTSAPPLAAHRLTEEEYRGFITSPSGYVGSTFRGDQILQRPGDAEVGIVFTVMDRPGLRVATTGLVRLPTGLLDRSENFFDLGTGDGQTDVEGRVAADLARGPFGMRLSLGYNRQLESAVRRRVNAPSQPLAYLYRLADLTRDPGDELTFGVEPFLRLAPGFAFSVGALHWQHGADEVSYAGAGVPGVAASTLAIDTKRSATALQAGLTYSSFAGIPGRGTPIEARWAYRSVVSASGGRVDKTKTMWFQFRAYYKLW